MILEWSVDEGLEFDPVLISHMQAAADYAVIAEGVHAECFACVRLCDDTSICEINARERNINRATDVLSFPYNSRPVKLHMIVRNFSGRSMMMNRMPAFWVILLFQFPVLRTRQENTDIQQPGKLPICWFMAFATCLGTIILRRKIR